MSLPRALPWLIRALPLAVALALTATAHADPAPDHGSRLVVRVAPDLALPAEEVRAVIAAELGVAIVKDAADLGSLDIHLDPSKKLAIEYHRPDGDTLVRIVTLPAHPSDRLSVIAFVTGNLVRDQLDGLAFGAGAQSGDIIVAAPADDAAPPADTLPVAAPAPTAAMPPAMTAPTVTASNTTIGASVEQAPETVVPIAIGLVPPLSTQGLFGGTTVRAGLYAIAGAATNIEGFSISGAADIASGHLRGAQIAGAVSVARDGVGLQVGGAASIARDFHGLQIGGAGVYARDVHAIQLGGAAAVARDGTALQAAGAAAIARDLRGIQMAGAASAARDTYGIQIAGAASIARTARGVQLGGATTVARHMYGLQMAGGTAVAGRIDGAQISPINVGGDVDGFQLGAINVGKHVHGLQVGAINISDDLDGVPIGAISVVRHGRTDVDAWAETTGLAAVALRHGSRRWHNIYAVGVTPDTGDRPMFGMGMGAHSHVGGFALDIDGMAWRTQLFDDGVGLLAQARATVALSLGSFDVFAAAAYNVSIESEGDDAPVTMALARQIDTSMSSNINVSLFPSLSAGIRGHLGGPR